MPGPTGAPKVGPSIVVPGRTPPIGGPMVLAPPTTNAPPASQKGREPSQRELTRQFVPPLHGVVQRCEGRGPGNWPGEPRSLASLQATIAGSFRETTSYRLVLSGKCFGKLGLLMGLTVFIRRGDGTIENLYQPTPSSVPSSSHLAIRSWTPTRIEFTVPTLLNEASLPLASTETLELELITANGRYIATLSPADVDKFQRDGTLTLPPYP
jgi:hypothetical protein